MFLIYLLARLYPYWAVPIAVVFVEMGMYYRRKKNKNMQAAAWFISAYLVFSSLIWVLFRGDQNSDIWIRRFFSP